MATPKSPLQLWIDLAKWFITSVVLATVTLIIDTGFRDRQTSLNEMKFYNNYVTELLVLNANPVQKRMLAQYFACVTPSEKLKEGWILYYDSIYPEYAAYVKPLIQEDSLLKEQYRDLLTSLNVTDLKHSGFAEIQARRDEIRTLLYPELKLPTINE